MKVVTGDKAFCSTAYDLNRESRSLVSLSCLKRKNVTAMSLFHM